MSADSGGRRVAEMSMIGVVLPKVSGLKVAQIRRIWVDLLCSFGAKRDR